MLQDLDALAARLQQLVTRVQTLKTERAQQQTTITDLQREREALRKRLAQSEAACSDARTQLAQLTQHDVQARAQHAAELAQVQAQATRAREQWQQDLRACQGERDQARALAHSCQAHAQRLGGAARQAHDLVDTLLVRLPDPGEA